MQTRRKILNIILCGLLLFPAAMVSAQTVRQLATAWRYGVEKETESAGKLLRQAEKLLSKRRKEVRESTLRAVQKNEDFLLEEEFPLVALINWPERNSSGRWPYEELALWKKLSTAAKRDYFLAANDRSIKEVINSRRKKQRKVKEALEDLWKQKISFPQRPQEELLVEMIPARANYILLGEIHEQTAILGFMQSFLKAYRAKYPQRSIFLLTEFLPQGDRKKMCLLRGMKKEDDFYVKVFNTALSLGIRIKGLEPKFAFYSCSQGLVSAEITTEPVSLLITPEIMRQRNQSWLQQIRKLRAENPEAVFIIYGGMEHIGYNNPFSVGDRLPAEETFVGVLHAKENEANNPRDLLEEYGGDDLNFKEQDILSWQSPVLRRAAGFDVRLLLPKEKYKITKKRKND